MSSNKEQVLLSKTKDEKLYKEYLDLITNYTIEDLYELFEEKSEKLSAEYHKVWHTYQCNLNAWLKYGYSDKVSLDTDRITLKYLENIIQ